MARDDRDESTGSARKGEPPWGDAFAVVGEGKDSTWIPLGAVWENKTGFHFTLSAEPIAWRDSRVERRIVMQKRRERGSR